MFDRLSSVLTALKDEVHASEAEDDNPALWALQKRFPNLFAFWDVRVPLSAEPGDIGVFDGPNPARPVFRKLANVAEQISGSDIYSKPAGTDYYPNASLWSTDVLDGGITRLYIAASILFYVLTFTIGSSGIHFGWVTLPSPTTASGFS
jgi:hypothetical protein